MVTIPENPVNHLSLDGYKPTFGYVHVPYIAIVFSILILLWYFVLRGSPVFTTFQGSRAVAGNVQRGSGMDGYLNYAGWYSAQENANGAEVGYIQGSPPLMYQPYNEGGITY